VKGKKNSKISDKAEKIEFNPTRPKNIQIIPWIVFLCSISIVLISFVSVMFPALILVSDTVKIPGIDPVTPDPFEIGVWSIGVIISSLITFGLAFLYFKNKLPKFLSSFFEKLFTFEISKKVSFVIFIVLLIIYISASSTELSSQEYYEDYTGVKNRLESWSPDQINSFEPHLRYFFLKASTVLFGNDRVIPFLASVALLVVTYFLTTTITQKRFAGIVSVVILMQSNVFLAFDTTVSLEIVLFIIPVPCLQVLVLITSILCSINCLKSTNCSVFANVNLFYFKK